MARILVTGANGFIGSHLVEELLKRGHCVTGMVRSDSDLSSIAHLDSKYDNRLNLVVGDILDSNSIDRVVDDAEFIYHLGAALMATSVEDFRVPNVDGTRNMLEAVAKRTRPDFKRFLFVSGHAAAGPSQDGVPIDESEATRPVSAYGKSKADAEKIVREFGSRVPFTIVRPGVVYGEREKDISGGTFPWVKAGFAPQIGFGSNKASLVYVADAVRGMIDAAESHRSIGETYFLLDATPYDQKEVIRAIAEAMGKRRLIPVIIPHSVISVISILAEWAHEFQGGRPMLTRDKVNELKQRWWVATPAAAKRDFGWSTQVSLQDGMARAVESWNQEK